MWLSHVVHASCSTSELPAREPTHLLHRIAGHRTHFATWTISGPGGLTGLVFTPKIDANMFAPCVLAYLWNCRLYTASILPVSVCRQKARYLNLEKPRNKDPHPDKYLLHLLYSTCVLPSSAVCFTNSVAWRTAVSAPRRKLDLAMLMLRR